MAKFVPVEPFDIVIFGGTGDLSRRKLLPALYHRWLDGQIPPSSVIIGPARQPMDDAGPRAPARTPCPAASGRRREVPGDPLLPPRLLVTRREVT